MTRILPILALFSIVAPLSLGETPVTVAATASKLPPSNMDFTQRIPKVLPKSAIFLQPGWCQWDPCIIMGKDGLYHLFYSRWKTKLGFDAWCSHAEIAWAVSSMPDRHYEFCGTVLPQRGTKYSANG